MDYTEEIDYQRIAKAIEYLKENFRKQPSLEETASHIHLSPFHFQRMFKKWAGISPKAFLQYTSVEYAKSLLHTSQQNLFNTAHQTGLSGTSRLHDLFVKIEAMTPSEYKNEGKNLKIATDFRDTPFGKVLLGTTEKGICYMAFVEDPKIALAKLKTKFAQAEFEEKETPFSTEALRIFDNDWTFDSHIKLHIKGTPFQLKVWEALLRIPQGELCTYGQLGKVIHKPQASRAIGTAIGSNPVAYLIPCHRVIRASGIIGGYRWGSDRKENMIAWEGAQNHPLDDHE